MPVHKGPGRVGARIAAGFACAALLAGCASNGSVWAQYFQMLRTSLHAGNRSVTRDQAAAVPYATMGLRVGDSAEQMLVLATDNDAGQLWTNASHVVLLIRDGRISRSVGLEHDRAALAARGGGNLPPPFAALTAPFRSVRIVDMPDTGNYNVTLTCTAAARGAQSISIIGTSIATIRVDEKCSSITPRWSFTDSFWLDAKSGFVWHSIQHLSPTGPGLQLEVLRPPG